MKKVLVLAACFLMMTGAAWADAYVGASVGQTDASSSGIDGDDSNWKLVGGYTFMKFFAVEGSYRDVGGLDETVGTTSVALDATSMDVFGVGRLPLGNKFSVFAKAGYALIDMEATISDPLGTVTASDTETELAYGAGFSYKVTDKIDLRLEYETFDTVDTLDMMSAGAVFRF